MKADDLAWVQAQLRSCRCIAKQLKICAEVTGSSEGVLLYELGYKDLHALQRAYPEKQLWCRGKKILPPSGPTGSGPPWWMRQLWRKPSAFIWRAGPPRRWAA